MKKYITKLIIITLLIMIYTKNYASAQMFWNNACSFAGTQSSYISRGNSSDLNITGSFTLEAWVNPSTISGNKIVLQKRESANPVGYTLYISNGKVCIRTNSVTRLVGNTTLPVNNWSHIAGRYNASTELFTIFVNGVFDDTATITGAAPASNTDSLFIGKGFNDPFEGQMDEIRIWNIALSAGDISQHWRLSLGTSSGIYDNLVMSLTFQDNDANGTAFTLTDQTGNGNSGVNRGVTAVDLSNRPYQTININDCIELDGNNDYLAAPDATTFSPSDMLTLEAWIYPESIDKENLIIHKGTDDGSTADYALKLYQGRLQAIVNNIIVLQSDDDIPLNRWSHIAFTYDGPNGILTFYINGKTADADINDKGFIVDGTDSLYIGGTLLQSDFDGYIDEVRITQRVKSVNEINQFLFKSIDESNDLSGTEAVYNFDGYTVSNVGTANRMFFRNNSEFSSSGSLNDKPVTPLDRADNDSFHDGYYMKTSDRRIPDVGTSGMMLDDTLNVLLNETINDINVFVAVNHEFEQQLSISLVSPGGITVSLLSSNNLVLNADNIVTIFDDNADSSIVNGRYVSFAPKIRPVSALNASYVGSNSFGKWRLVINDMVAIDTGRLYGWGIQFNNSNSKSTLLSSRALIQGFYDSSTDLMTRDTMRFYMRYTYSPYEIQDSAKAHLLPNGSAVLTFNNIVNGIFYYIHLKHRNSIETWSSTGISFDPLTSQAVYDFTSSITQAYGENMILADNSPVLYAIYGGDVDQNGSVEAFDLSSIDNDAANFVTGYVINDVTGDDIVDAVDAALTDNNASNFVSASLPPVLDENGNVIPSRNILNKKSDNSEKTALINEYALEHNFPNPFNPVTRIIYKLPEDNFVSIKVFDVNGKEVMTLVNEKQTKGIHSVNFDGSNLASGVYYYKMTSGNFNDAKTMTLIK
ncbi:MAG: hypothetical protein HGGPFJEG_01164 [Ignavibacteria bacterium]|nr:hypothetical protein [Ignavibacteria bacterium]